MALFGKRFRGLARRNNTALAPKVETIDTVGALEKALLANFPAQDAEEWDRTGLLVGDRTERIEGVAVALDATLDAVQAAVAAQANVLVTHHPLIFGGIKNVSEQDFVGRRVLALAEHGIAYYAMHTNYDADLMGDLAAERIALQSDEPLLVSAEYYDDQSPAVGMGRIGELPDTTTLKVLAERVQHAFGAESLHEFGEEAQEIRRVAVLPGSGKSGVDQAISGGADVLVTGDISHLHRSG